MNMENDNEIIEQFVAEAKEHLDTIEDDFLRLEKQKENPEQGLIDKVFRAIHSIKGAAGFLGLEKIGSLSHVMETLLSMIRAREIRPESEIIDALLEGADLLGFMVDHIEQSNETDITKVHDHLSTLLARQLSPQVKAEMNTAVSLSGSKGDVVGFDISEFKLKNIPSDMLLYVLKYDLMKLEESPVLLIKKLLSTGEVIDAKIDTLSDDLHDGLPQSPLMYEVLYATPSDFDNIRQITGLSKNRIIPVKRNRTDKKPEKEADQECKVSLHNGKETLRSVLGKNTLHSELSEEPQAQKIAMDHGSTIRINVDILDKLMLLAGELVLVRNQQLISVDSVDLVSRSIAQRLDAVTSELQETIMRSRMQPIGKIFGKFPRIVRELGKQLGKSIRISINGSDVELDRTILESLTDPLTHIIRNCCDHGIEIPDERVRNGKAEFGSIVINAYHEAGQINIRIKDDGKGISPEAIRKKAIEKGIKNATELKQMSDKEILRLILIPGFSLADEVSNLSGRGVGMDVVKTELEKMGGVLEIESTVGEGTAIHLRLPLTLAIIPCLMVAVGEHIYAIPQINLVELVCLYDDDVRTKIEYAGEQEVYRLRNRLLPMVRLPEILARPKPFTKEIRAEIAGQHRVRSQEPDANSQQPTANLSDLSLNFAVIKIGDNRFGLIIDKILGTEEIVVKPMHPALKSLKIYSGATVMGDGNVALILDVNGIAEHAGILFNIHAEGNIERNRKTRDDEDSQTVLIFKYGKKEWFAIALPLIRRIERISVSDIEQIGDKEFITIDGISVFILRPNNVLKVSSFDEEKEEMFLILPKYIQRPVGLLASELIDIELTSVKLNVESYFEDGLLGTTIVRGHMTLFIDIYRLVEKADPEWFTERRKKTPPPESVKQILLVEDASFFRQLVKGYLEADGYKVITAENGRAGLEQMNQHNFDMIVSDIEMPIMDGLDFLKNVRQKKRWQHIPAIALTALDTEKDQEIAIKCGFDRYEVKIDREQFLTAVAELL